MARSLGSLVVSLGLNAAEFTTGLTKSEREAQKFARSIDKGIATAVNVATIALAAMTTAAIAGFVAMDQLAKQAGNFKDLEEKTGASAEALASFSVSAQIAGTDVATVAGAMNKLAKGLTGVDDESKAAGAALAALDINIEDFKKLDPATQMETVAKALAGFQDGAAKSAVAMALFGKSGAELLPFFKELASGAGRVVILNQKLIEQADEYADRQAKAKAELNLFAQVAATQALPALTALTDTIKQVIQELIGVNAEGKKLRDSTDVADFAKTAALALADVVDVGDAVIRVFRAVGIAIGADLAVKAQLATGNISGAISTVKELLSDLDKLALKQQFSAKLAQRFAEDAKTAAQRSIEDRGFKPPGKVLQFTGVATGAGKGGADKISEGERLIESLQKQLEGLQDLTAAEKVLLDVSLGRIKGVTHAEVDAALGIAQQIDAKKAATKAEEERKRAQEDALRSEERIFEIQQRSIEAEKQNAESIKQGNESLREQLAFLKGGEEGLRAYTDAKLALAIADNIAKEASKAAQGASEAELEAIRATTAALKERQQITSELRLAEKLREEARALQDVKNMISDTFADAFTSFITGAKSAKDAFKQFTDSLVQQISRIASQNIANALFGGKNQAGPDFFAVLAKLLGGLGGGSTATPAITDFSDFFAMGGVSRGGLAVVGERGPELVNLPRGARVTPNHQINRGGGSVSHTWNVNVLPGANTATARQAAKEIERRVRSQSVRG